MTSWTPAIERGRLPIPRYRGELVVAEPSVIRRHARRIEEAAPQEFLARKRVNVGYVALFASAELDAERVDQHETIDPLETADAHLQRDPPAKRRACQRHLAKILAFEQVQVKVGEIVDGAESLRPLGIAEAGMPRDDYPPVPRQSIEEFLVLREIVAAMKEQQWRTVSGRQQIERKFIDLDALHFRPLFAGPCTHRDPGSACTRRLIPRCGILS